MRHVWLLVSGLSLLNPCSKKDENADAAAEAAAPVATVDPDAEPPPPAEPVAKNAAKVARFPGDTKLDMAKEKLQATHTVARESPGGGAVVATLKKDTEVTKIASRNDFFLVGFPDPTDAAAILIGWIPASGFQPTVVIKTACPKGTVRFETVGCRIDCSKTACPTGMNCTGVGTRPEVDDGAFKYCEGADAGAPPPATVDAGPPPKKRPTMCPMNHIGWDDGKCHLKCTTAAECGNGKTCTSFGNGVSGCLP
jgi:hypothetical protein